MQLKLVGWKTGPWIPQVWKDSWRIIERLPVVYVKEQHPPGYYFYAQQNALYLNTKKQTGKGFRGEKVFMRLADNHITKRSIH